MQEYNSVFKSSLGYHINQKYSHKTFYLIFIQKQSFRDVEAEYPVKGSELHPLDSS